MVVARSNMSKTLLTKVHIYAPKEKVNRIDKNRGPITRSKFGLIALDRLMFDIENGKVNLLTLELKEQATGVTDNS